MEGLSLFIGMFRRFRSIVLRREVEIVGQCQLCGNCCRGILLKNRERWLRTEAQYKELCEDDPGHERFKITGKDQFGNLCFACSWQGDDNLCSRHEERLPLCREYPTKGLYYQGGWLGNDCGFSFKAVKFRDIFMRRRRARIPSFDKLLQQEQDKKRSSQ